MTAAELLAAGVAVDAAAFARLTRYVALFQAENERTNLTAIKTPPEIWRLHVCDALALLPLLRLQAPETLLDFGTGGGVPGLPLACALPELQVTLLDATRKKIAAVERMAAALQLTKARCLWGRAEELAHRPDLRERFDLVTARAVAALPFLLEFASGFIRVGGAAAFYLTPASIARDADEAPAPASQCGFGAPAEHRYRLPGDDADRVILVYPKITALAAELPRHPTVAKGIPLRIPPS